MIDNYDRLIKLDEVQEITGFKKSFIYDKERKGEFPKRRKIGRATRWVLSEILIWNKQHDFAQSA